MDKNLGTIQTLGHHSSMETYWVYITTNFGNTVFYTGVTNDIERRMAEHQSMSKEGFTKRYRTTKLVYCESFSGAMEAITAEKKIKGWLRIKKLQLIVDRNAEFKDLMPKNEILRITSE